MAENKTIENDADVNAFITSVENKRRQSDSFTLLEMMTRITGYEAKMWGQKIVGFGKYHYKYDSGREGDSSMIAFSPGKANMTVYLMDGFDKYKDELEQLGKYKSSRVCMYINKLDDVDLTVLEDIILKSVTHFKTKYGA